MAFTLQIHSYLPVQSPVGLKANATGAYHQTGWV